MIDQRTQHMQTEGRIAAWLAGEAAAAGEGRGTRLSPTQSHDAKRRAAAEAFEGGGAQGDGALFASRDEGADHGEGRRA